MKIKLLEYLRFAALPAVFVLVFTSQISFLSTSVYAKQILLTENARCIPLAGKMELLHDTSGVLTFNEVRSAGLTNNFKAIQGNIANGFIKGALWVRITLLPQSNAPLLWLLEITPPVNEHIQLYTLDSNNKYLMAQAGNLAIKSNLTIDYRNPVFRLQLQPNMPQTLYLRISSQRAIIAKPLLWQPDSFHHTAVKVSLFHGLYAGCSIVIIALNLIFWFRLRNTVYFYYFLYISGLFILFVESNGYLFQFVLTENPWLSIIALRISLAILIASGPGFLSELLQLKKYLPKTDKWFRYTSNGVALIAALLSFTPLRYQIGKLLYLSIFVSAALSICIGGYLATKKVPLARLYLASFFPTLLLGIYSALMNLGIIPSYNAFEHLLLFSTILHMILLNIGVADRISNIKAEKIEIEVALSTERQTVEQQSQFVRLISHELRTPLAIIDSTVQILPLIIHDPLLLNRKAEAIKAATRRLETLLYSCLNVERLALEGFKPEFLPVDIKSLILSLCNYAQIISKKHHISAELDGLPETFQCDFMLIEVMVGNLLDNAVKYSPAGGDISIRGWSDPQGNLNFEVRDLGIGIPPEEVENIFNRFYRAGKLPGVSGVGLGLYLVRQIAEIHGGAITCNSVQGQGSVFSIKLPRCPP